MKAMSVAQSAVFSGITMIRIMFVAIVLVVLPAGAEEPASVDKGLQLPVSINEVMVALVNDAADPIWVAAWNPPETDAQWRELERRAYQLQLGGSLIAYPGTGGLDHKWTAKPPWRRWANKLRDAAGEAIVGVQARDLEQISVAGDHIVETCEGCHQAFKLDFPTGGKYGELSPTADDL
jgi:hypothetical protein